MPMRPRTGTAIAALVAVAAWGSTLRADVPPPAPEPGVQAAPDAPAKPAVRHNVSLYPSAGPLVGGVGVGYARALFDVLTVGARLGYVFPWRDPYHLVLGEVSVYYWPRRPLSGFFVGPILAAGRSISTNDRATGATQLAVNVILGWRWLWSCGVNVGAGLGLGYGGVVSQHNGCPAGVDCGGSFGPGGQVGATGRFDVGYAF